MYKSRHSGWWHEHKRVRAVGESGGSLHFNAFLQINITVGTGNLWLSNIAATLFHQLLLKLCHLDHLRTLKDDPQAEWSIKQTVGTPLCQHLSMIATCLCNHVSNAVCDSFVSLNAAFPGSAVNQGPSSLLEQQARVQKKWLHWSKLNRKKPRTPSTLLVSYVHLKTNISIYIDHF